ncbi:MAG: O-antigen ligase family protein [Elusimicrobia bacterium]|nr:O-antigen ligase family protein [Elusimicrobiota bacterium]
MGYALILVGMGGLLWQGARSWEAWLTVSGLIWLVGIFGFWKWDRDRCGIWWVWVGWLVLSVVSSQEPWTSAEALAHVIPCVFFFTVGVGLWGEGHQEVWLVSLWLLGSFLGAWALCQRIFIDGASPGWIPPNPNYTGCVMGAVLVSSLSALTLGKREGWHKVLLLLIVTLAAATLWNLRSRGAILSVFLLIPWLGLGRFSRRGIWVTGILFALLLGIMSLPQWEALTKVQSESFSYRTWIWQTGIRVAQQFPLLGIGPGVFERGYLQNNFPAFNGLSYYGHYADNAHSHLIQLAAESGIWVAILFIWAFLESLGWAWKSFKQDQNTLRVAAVASAAAVFLHASVDGIFVLPGIQLLFFGCLACAVCGDSEQWSEISSTPRTLAVAGFLFCGSVLGISRIIPRDKNTSPANFEVYAAAAREAILRRPSNPAQAWGFLAQAAEQNPTNAVLWAQRAEVVRGFGDWPEVARCAYRAVGLEPNFVAAHLLLAESLWRLGRTRAAKQELERAVRIHADKNLNKPTSGYEEFIPELDEQRFKFLRQLFLIEPLTHATP